ncbi:MAG: DMT family transporter [Candidatus Aenigmarchaeota archaeon]|nr:DMT family transporter [Candidatus Aenigmarchaeota archaeon]
MDNHLKGYIYVITSLLLTGVAFIAMTVALRTAEIQTALFFMFATGFVLSSIMLVATRKIDEAKTIAKKYWKPLLVIGALNAVTAFLWLLSLNLVGPSVTAFVGRFGTIFTILMSVIFLKERFNRLELVGALIMIAGAFVLSYNGGNFIIFGVLVVITMSFLFSNWQFMSKRYIKHISPLVMNHARFTITFVIVGTYVLLTGNLSVPSLTPIALIMLSSVCGGIIGFILIYKAMEIADLSKISTIQSLEPFVIMVYSALILGSIPTGYQLMGGIVIVGGALLMILARYRPKFIEAIVG